MQWYGSIVRDAVPGEVIGGEDAAHDCGCTKEHLCSTHRCFLEENIGAVEGGDGLPCIGCGSTGSTHASDGCDVGILVHSVYAAEDAGHGRCVDGMRAALRLILALREKVTGREPGIGGITVEVAAESVEELLDRLETGPPPEH